METLKSVGAVFLAIAFIVAIGFVGGWLIFGIAWVSANTLSYLVAFSRLVVAICIFVFLPLAFFHVTRSFAAIALLASSYVFGLTVWLYGFLVTYFFWGALGVFFGLVLGIVGIVPLGMIAAAFNSAWGLLLTLVEGLVLTYGARLLAFWLADKVEKRERRQRAPLIDEQIDG